MSSLVKGLEHWEKNLTTSKDQSLNPSFKFRSMDIVKLDAVQLYKCQRSNKAVGVLVL